MKPITKKNSDGFTLVELLVAITIFSLVVGMAMFSLRYSFTVVRHLDAPFAEETQRLSRMRDCICSMFNYVVPSRDIFNNRKGFATFFTGEPESMIFISATPPSGRTLAVCRLSLVNGDLVLEEAPLYADTTNYLSPSLESGDKKSTVIVAGVTSFRLEYLRNGKKESSLKAALPSLVRIVMAADGKESEYYCRIPTNFQEKALLIRGINEPI
ncbi:MAG: prepilin-type N-terminal cleavage/methylation domain-containing protein [Desulfuromonadales bacterium]